MPAEEPEWAPAEACRAQASGRKQLQVLSRPEQVARQLAEEVEVEEEREEPRPHRALLPLLRLPPARRPLQQAQQQVLEQLGCQQQQELAEQPRELELRPVAQRLAAEQRGWSW